MLKNNYLKKSIASGIGNTAGSALIAFLSIPIIINNIGIKNYGIIAILAIFGGVSSILELGVGKSLIFYIPKVKNNNQRNELFSSGLIINTIVIIFIILIGTIIMNSNIKVFGNNSQIDESVYRTILICGLAILCLSLSMSYFKSILEASYKIYQVNILSLLSTLGYYLSICILSYLGFDINVILIGIVVAYGLIWFMFLYFVFVVNEYTVRLPTLTTNMVIIKQSMGFFSFSAISSLVLPLNRYIFVVFCGDIKAYGVFDVALKIVLASNTILTSFSIPLYSLFSGYGVGGLHEIKKIVYKYTLFLISGYILGVSLFYVFGESLSAIFIKESFKELYLSTFVMLILYIPVAVVEPIVRAFWALDDIWFVAKARMLLPVFNGIIFLCLAGIPSIYRFSIAYTAPFLIYTIIISAKYLNRYYLCDKKLTFLQ